MSDDNTQNRSVLIATSIMSLILFIYAKRNFFTTAELKNEAEPWIDYSLSKRETETRYTGAHSSETSNLKFDKTKTVVFLHIPKTGGTSIDATWSVGKRLENGQVSKMALKVKKNIKKRNIFEISTQFIQNSKNATLDLI